MGFVSKTIIAGVSGAYLLAGGAGEVKLPVSQETVEYAVKQVGFAAAEAPTDLKAYFEAVKNDPAKREEIQKKYKVWANDVSQVTWVPLAQGVQAMLLQTFSEPLPSLAAKRKGVMNHEHTF